MPSRQTSKTSVLKFDASRIQVQRMSLWKTIRQILNFPFVQVDHSILGELHALADQEGRSKDAVASELLNQALQQRRIAEQKLECWRTLSPRQQEVVALACLHYTNRQIAKRLAISKTTVSTHMRTILKKFGLHSKSELRLYLADWDFSAWE
jgi:DNA-binding NarL/FixJ family response regulator